MCLSVFDSFIFITCSLTLACHLKWQYASALVVQSNDNEPTWGSHTADYSTNRLFDDLLSEICGQTLHKKVRLESFEGIRGIAACSPLKRGSDIVRIPISKCWRGDRDSLEDDTIASLCESVIQNLEQEGLYQALLPVPEEFRAYLPVYWPPSLIKELELEVSGFTEELASLIGERDDTARTLEKQGYTRDDITRSLDLVQTRSCRVALEKGSPSIVVPIMAPVFDMFNHATSSVNSYYLTEESDDDDFLVIRACSDIDPGQQIFLDYGSSTRPSWRCLLHYGFVPDEISDQDTATISVDGTKYQVTGSRVPYDLVEALASAEGFSADEPAFMPEVAMRLAQIASLAANEVLHSQSSIPQLNSLRESQRKVLLRLQATIEWHNRNLWRSWNNNAWELLDNEVFFRLSR